MAAQYEYSNVRILEPLHLKPAHMKKFIALLRISGIASLLAFLLITALGAKISQTAEFFGIISILCFSLIIVIQLYRFYVRKYMRE